MKHYTNIVVTGSMGYDVIMDFPSRFADHLQPDRLHQLNVSFVVDRLEKQLGGTGTNISYNLGLMKNENVRLLASVGRDGDRLIDFLKEKGIDTGGILKDEELYSFAGNVVTDRDSNQIWAVYYGACERAKNIRLADYANEDSIVVISANHPEAFRSFQRQAIEMGVDYLYDAGMTLAWNTGEGLKEGVRHARFLVGNDYEIARVMTLTGFTVDQLVHDGIIVVTTLGGEGVRYRDSETDLYVPAFSDKPFVDPTGAGDAWRAGFLTGILRKTSIEEALRLGNSLASFAVACYGTANHSPTAAEVEERADSLKKVAL
jgi:adenosine kinase